MISAAERLGCVSHLSHLTHFHYQLFKFVPVTDAVKTICQSSGFYTSLAISNMLVFVFYISV